MALLSNADFLKAAAALFEQSQIKKSSIYITQKRLIENDPVSGNEEALKELSQFNQHEPLLKSSNISKSTKTYPILIRVTDGNSDKSKKTKISTTVNPDELSKFWREYSSVIKSGSKGLKKKGKGKKKKKSAK